MAMIGSSLYVGVGLICPNKDNIDQSQTDYQFYEVSTKTRIEETLFIFWIHNFEQSTCEARSLLRSIRYIGRSNCKKVRTAGADFYKPFNFFILIRAST